MMGLPYPPHLTDAIEQSGWQNDLPGQLRAFLTATAACDDLALLAAIRMNCDLGRGIWTEPPAQPHAAHRPATHLFEISLFGQSAVGFTPDHAAHNWRIAATRSLQPIDGTPA